MTSVSCCGGVFRPSRVASKCTSWRYSATLAAITTAIAAHTIKPFAAQADIRDPLPRSDLILCRDCLVHLSFQNIARAVARFRASGAEFLLVTTFPEWEDNRDCEDGDWRALNMTKPPFHWPPLHELIDERCEEGDGGWRDKSLGLWRLDELPDGGAASV